MHLRPLFRRRPSAALVISLVALFVSLGGVGYAATQLPANSVGTSQLRNNAVSYKKIQPQAVGRVRANLNQLQARVGGMCRPQTAIAAISSSGKAQCSSTLPQVISYSGTQTVPPAATAPTGVQGPALTQIANVTIDDGHNYIEFADPMVTVTGNGTPQRVTVTCLLESGKSTESRSVTIDTGTSTAPSSASMSLVNGAGPGETGVACYSGSSATPAATVSVTSSLYALQTQN